jgi:hypothetical protein
MDSETIDSIIQKSLDDKIYETKIWYGLLHYDGKKSVIDNKDFFLSGDKFSPKNELIETIKSFYFDKIIFVNFLQNLSISLKSYN